MAAEHGQAEHGQAEHGQAEHGQTDVRMRLRRIEGQIRGIIGMLNDGKSCEDVVTQIFAARAAMDCVAREVLKCQVADVLGAESSAETRQAIERAINLLAKV